MNTRIAELLAEAAALSQQAVLLAHDGRIREALELEDRADRLRRAARRANLGKERRRKTLTDNKETAGPGREQGYRAITIAALGELGIPTSPRSLSEYVWGRYDTRIDPRALASLRRDEMRAWLSPRSVRAVYVVPALEGRRFLAVRGKVALSDWPIEQRLIGPWSERVDHLRATAQLARQYRWLSKTEPAAAERLTSLLSLYAATVPGAQTSDGSLDATTIEQAASAELEVVGPRDTEWRTEAGQRARRILDDQQLLWGAPAPKAVGGSRA